MKERKTKRLNLLLKPSTLDKLEKIATKENRTKSNVLENFIENYEKI